MLPFPPVAATSTEASTNCSTMLARRIPNRQGWSAPPTSGEMGKRNSITWSKMIAKKEIYAVGDAWLAKLPRETSKMASRVRVQNLMVRENSWEERNGLIPRTGRGIVEPLSIQDPPQLARSG